MGFLSSVGGSGGGGAMGGGGGEMVDMTTANTQQGMSAEGFNQAAQLLPVIPQAQMQQAPQIQMNQRLPSLLSTQPLQQSPVQGQFNPRLQGLLSQNAGGV